MFKNSRCWWVLLAMGCMIVIINLDMTIVNIALPTFAQDFHLRIAGLQWIINAYLLLAAVFYIPGGRWSDRFGRKTIFMIGGVIFIAGSLVAGFSSDFAVLIIGRLLQGVGLAFTLPHSIVLASLAFPENRRGFAVGCLVTFSGVSQALGPVIGAVILTYLSWRWIFFINVPIGLISLAVAFFACKKESATDITHISSWQVLFSMLFIFLIMLAFTQVTFLGLSSWVFWTVLGVGLFLGLLFIFLQIKSRSPLMDLKLFEHRVYRTVNIIRCFFQYVFYGAFFILPIYFQNIVGYSILKTGVLMIAITLMLGLISQIAGRAIDKIGPCIPFYIGHAFGVAGFIMLAFTGANPSLVYIVFALVGFGVYLGITLPGVNVVAMKSLPVAKAGQGMSILFTTAAVSSVIGVAITALLIKTISLYLVAHAVNLNQFDVTQVDLIKRFNDGTTKLADFKKLATPGILHLLPVLKLSFIKAYHAAIWVFVGMIVLGALFIPWLRER